MRVYKLVELIDYPDDVIVTIYDYSIMDTVFVGLGEDIPAQYCADEVVGLEFPSKNEVIFNIKHQ